MVLKRRIELKQVDAIFCADLHLRSDVPICRVDNYWQAQETKLNFIISLAKKHRCPIIIAGDAGHKSEWNDALLRWTIKKIEDLEIYLTPGQHDLPNHNLEKWEESGVGVLESSCKNFIFMSKNGFIDLGRSLFVVFSFPFGEKIKHLTPEVMNNRKIAVSHQLIIEGGKLEWPEQKAIPAQILLKEFPEYNIILTGDNHKPFVVEHQGRYVVNPGSMMRMSADQIDHKPRVYLWNAETNQVKAEYLPIDDNVIDRGHIDDPTEKDKRMKAYVEHLQKGRDISLSFEQNMERFLQSNHIDKTVKDKIRRAMI
jgi:DNA repair exonuclease SbcCD nuclease subunit